MSAWLCNEEHIYEIAHHYVAHVVATTMSVDKVAKILYDANVESLVSRYDDNKEDMPMEVLSHYRPIVIDTMHMAKLVGCFEYQACEYAGWEDSEAHAICMRIMESFNLPEDYRKTKEYAVAPWDFNRAEYIHAVASMYYGVTDHHIIVPLKVIKRTTVEDFVKIETEIFGESNDYMECHHHHYFKEMWLDEDGLPDKGNVFVNKTNAIAYALKKANEEIETKQAAIDYIKEQVVKLSCAKNL